MRSAILSVACIVWLALVSTTAQPPQKVGESQPTVRSLKGKPLHQLFSSGLPAVVVEKDQSAPHYVNPPPGVSELEWLTSLVPYVFVISVDTMEADLSPDEDWITTKVTTRIDNVLKKPLGDSISPGTAVQFFQDGGELTIRQTKVRAVLPWTEGFKQGRSYLVFASRTSDAMWQIEPASSYEINPSNERLEPLARRGKARSESQVPFEVASRRIRAQAAKVK